MDAGAAWQSPNPMVQLRIGGLIDLARPTLSDEGGDVVMAESGADLKSHGWIEGIVCRCPTLSSSLHGMAARRRTNG